MTKPTGVGRGGARAGAGRPEGATGKTFWSPEQVERFRARIQTDKIIDSLNAIGSGEIEGTSHRVSAALGLLKKVIPDLSQTESKTETTHNFVIQAPQPVKTIEAWQNDLTPSSGVPSLAPKAS